MGPRNRAVTLRQFTALFSSSDASFSESRRSNQIDTRRFSSDKVRSRSSSPRSLTEDGQGSPSLKRRDATDPRKGRVSSSSLGAHAPPMTHTLCRARWRCPLGRSCVLIVPRVRIPISTRARRPSRPSDDLLRALASIMLGRLVEPCRWCHTLELAPPATQHRLASATGSRMKRGRN